MLVATKQPTYVLQTVDTAPFYGRSANNQCIIDTAHSILLSVIVCTIEVFSTPPSNGRFILKSGRIRADV